MRTEDLPSPGALNEAGELRRVAAQAISYVEIVKARSPDSTSMAELADFFTACAAACAPT